MGDGDTLLNAALGALVTVVLSGVVPVAPLVGGAVAGYLQGGDRGDGLRVGLVSGLVAVVPAALVFAFVFSALTAVLFSVGEPGIPFAVGGLFAVVAVFVVATIVGLSALGGWVGNYVRYDTGVEF